MQSKSKKPPVRHVHLDLLNRLPHATYPKHKLYNGQFNQNDRVEAGSSIVFAIAVFLHFVDEAPIDGVFQLPYKVIFRYKIVQARELDLIPVPSSLSRHHFPRPLVLILP